MSTYAPLKHRLRAYPSERGGTGLGTSEISSSTRDKIGARELQMLPRKPLQDSPSRIPFHSLNKGRPRNQENRLNWCTGSLPFLTRPPPQTGLSPSCGVQLPPSLQSSPPLRPQSFLNLPSSPHLGPTSRAPSPSLTCASCPSPAGHPPPQPRVHRVQAQESGLGVQRRGSQAAGGCGRKQSCLHGCGGFSLPPKAPPPVPPPFQSATLRAAAPPSVPRPQDVRIRRSGRRNPAQIKSCSTP